MNQNTPNPQPENEIDILALFEYFKKGIKSIFKGIKNAFLWLGNLIADFLLMLRKNWILVLSSMLIFGLIGYFSSDFLKRKFMYEIIVKANFDSSYELYNRISNLNDRIKENNKLAAIQEYKIEPVKRKTDEIDKYYQVTRNREITGNPDLYSRERDTIFYTEVEVKDFTKELKDFDYPIQRISVKTFDTLSVDQLKKEIFYPFDKPNSYWKKESEKRKQRITKKIDITQKSINAADSLLKAYANPNFDRTQNTNISFSPTAASTNVERDLLEVINALNDDLELFAVEYEKSDEIIQIVSDFKRVEDTSLRSKFNLYSGLLTGFLLALGFIILLELNKFLNRYDQAKKAK